MYDALGRNNDIHRMHRHTSSETSTKQYMARNCPRYRYKQSIPLNPRNGVPSASSSSDAAPQHVAASRDAPPPPLVPFCPQASEAFADNTKLAGHTAQTDRAVARAYSCILRRQTAGIDCPLPWPASVLYVRVCTCDVMGSLPVNTACLLGSAAEAGMAGGLCRC